MASSSASAIERVYAIHTILQDAGSRITEHEADFASLLTLAKGRDSKALQLAVPLLSQFVHHFPDQVAAVIDCFVDLCEEDDLKIRLVAIKELPAICQTLTEQTGSVADVLTQLLQSEVQAEFDEVRRSFLKLIRIDAKAALASLVNVAHSQSDFRSKAISFLCSPTVKTALQPATSSATSTTTTTTTTSADRKRTAAAKSARPAAAATPTPLLEYLLEILPPLVQEAAEPERYQLLAVFDDLQLTAASAQRLLDLAAITFASYSPATHLGVLSRCLTSLRPFLKALTNTDKLLPPTRQTINDFALTQGNAHRVSVLREILELVIHTRHEPELESVYKLLLELLPLPPRDGEEEKLIDFSVLEPVFLLFQALAARHPVQAQQIASSPKFNDTIAPRLKHLIAVTQQHFTDLQTVQKQLKAELETESVSSANRAVIRTKLAKVLLPYWTIRSVLHCSKLLLQTPAQFQCRLEARSWRLEELHAKQIEKEKRTATASSSATTTSSSSSSSSSASSSSTAAPSKKPTPSKAIAATAASKRPSTDNKKTAQPSSATQARKREREPDSSSSAAHASKRPRIQQPQQPQKPRTTASTVTPPGRRLVTARAAQPQRPATSGAAVVARPASTTSSTTKAAPATGGRRVVVVSR